MEGSSLNPKTFLTFNRVKKLCYLKIKRFLALINGTGNYLIWILRIYWEKSKNERKKKHFSPQKAST